MHYSVEPNRPISYRISNTYIPIKISLIHRSLYTHISSSQNIPIKISLMED